MATLAVIGTTVSLIATAASVGLSVAGGVAANKAAKRDAARLREIGAAEAEDKRRATRKLIARQQVAFAGAGVDPQVGSPLDVLGDTVAESELAALRVQHARESQALGVRQQGRLALFQGAAGATSTLLGGANEFLGRPA